MSARRQIIAALSEDSLGGIATLADVDHATQLVNAHRAEVLDEASAIAKAMPTDDCSDADSYDDAWDRGSYAVGERLRETANEAREQGSYEAPPLTIYRASHESIPFGLYTTAAAAREHCETYERRDQPTAELDWIEDEEDGVAELVAAFGEDERSTGYVVTALEVASKYDAEADE